MPNAFSLLILHFHFLINLIPISHKKPGTYLFSHTINISLQPDIYLVHEVHCDRIDLQYSMEDSAFQLPGNCIVSLVFIIVSMTIETSPQILEIIKSVISLKILQTNPRDFPVFSIYQPVKCT